MTLADVQRFEPLFDCGALRAAALAAAVGRARQRPGRHAGVLAVRQPHPPGPGRRERAGLCSSVHWRLAQRAAARPSACDRRRSAGAPIADQLHAIADRRRRRSSGSRGSGAGRSRLSASGAGAQPHAARRACRAATSRQRRREHRLHLADVVHLPHHVDAMPDADQRRDQHAIAAAPARARGHAAATQAGGERGEAVGVLVRRLRPAPAPGRARRRRRCTNSRGQRRPRAPQRQPATPATAAPRSRCAVAEAARQRV